MTSPTQRALAFCKAQGWTVQVVEKWNPWSRTRLDLFGCIDLVVLDGVGGGPLGVQVTSGSNVSSRVSKARGEKRIWQWLDSPARFEVWGFHKKKRRKKDGSFAKTYEWVLQREVFIPPQAAQPRIDPAMWDL